MHLERASGRGGLADVVRSCRLRSERYAQRLGELQCDSDAAVVLLDHSHDLACAFDPSRSGGIPFSRRNDQLEREVRAMCRGWGRRVEAEVHPTRGDIAGKHTLTATGPALLQKVADPQPQSQTLMFAAFFLAHFCPWRPVCQTAKLMPPARSSGKDIDRGDGHWGRAYSYAVFVGAANKNQQTRGVSRLLPSVNCVLRRSITRRSDRDGRKGL